LSLFACLGSPAQKVIPAWRRPAAPECWTTAYRGNRKKGTLPRRPLVPLRAQCFCPQCSRAPLVPLRAGQRRQPAWMNKFNIRLNVEKHKYFLLFSSQMIHFQSNSYLFPLCHIDSLTVMPEASRLPLPHPFGDKRPVIEAVGPVLW
jgi:hypothetical protein